MPFESSYCFPLTGNIENLINKLRSDHEDELMSSANFTNDNIDLYQSIGNNLVYSYYENYTCTELHSISDYNIYPVLNCASFSSDGTCLIQNDENYFNKYVEVLYQNITSNYCSNYDSNGQCIDNKSNSNPSALNPLLSVLKKSLSIDNLQNSTLDNSTQTKVNNKIYNWPGPCKPIPKVVIEITCPKDYSVSDYLTCKFLFITLILFFIYF